MKTIGCLDVFVAIAARQLYESVSFYQGLLGQDPQVLIPASYAEFRLPRLKLAIFQPKSDGEQEFFNSTRGAMSLCLEVEDLTAAIAHLTDLGYAPPNEILTASHGREIYAYDPDGNRLILHESPSTVGHSAS